MDANQKSIGTPATGVIVPDAALTTAPDTLTPTLSENVPVDPPAPAAPKAPTIGTEARARGKAAADEVLAALKAAEEKAAQLQAQLDAEKAKSSPTSLNATPVHINVPQIIAERFQALQYGQALIAREKDGGLITVDASAQIGGLYFLSSDKGSKFIAERSQAALKALGAKASDKVYLMFKYMSDTHEASYLGSMTQVYDAVACSAALINAESTIRAQHLVADQAIKSNKTRAKGSKSTDTPQTPTSAASSIFDD